MITDTDAVPLGFYNMIQNGVSFQVYFRNTVQYTYETKYLHVMPSTKTKKFSKIYIIQHYILMRHT